MPLFCLPDLPARGFLAVMPQSHSGSGHKHCSCRATSARWNRSDSADMILRSAAWHLPPSRVILATFAQQDFLGQSCFLPSQSVRTPSDSALGDECIAGCLLGLPGSPGVLSRALPQRSIDGTSMAWSVLQSRGTSCLWCCLHCLLSSFGSSNGLSICTQISVCALNHRCCGSWSLLAFLPYHVR